jgi:hypothetical protein
MILRSLPFLQTSRICFTDEWQHEWEVLDNSLRVSVKGLGSLGEENCARIHHDDRAKIYHLPRVALRREGVGLCGVLFRIAAVEPVMQRA